ncbi:hypothetical protein ACRE_014580 [Hapsidospora chrysogenum ATCC 11550]|uniref:Uncharacterized protein n=1 Tax=Hapsidospora chrysogenum (strain ATCC 11550 / CBS 779.69 / DSM 880 / IAM 14645 / JCM 23072 / IMI 49137) TaxID=857340 RepID=A0A086TEC6_HAPC1|nr:hypothetical protein ACRE_014580 [Hapsidospora chrysogenum ATCC 11550]
MAPSTKRQPSSVSGSWRIVEGENDSFDTTLAPSLLDDDDLSSLPSSGQPPSSSGFPSQGQMSLNSQDSIRDFSRHQDDPANIMRDPFRPSLPTSARTTSYGGSSTSTARPPDMEFRMPRVDVEDSGTRGQRGTDRRIGNMPGTAYRRRPGGRRRHDSDDEEGPTTTTPTVKDRITDSVPGALLDVMLWVLGVIALAFRYAQRPLALLLAIYVSFGAIIMAQNMATRSIHVSLAPICRLPGAGLLHLPFCPSPLTPSPGGPADDAEPRVLEFDDLMGVQGKLEEVLEKSADGVSLPYEMKRSETTIRDLRTLVKSSDLRSRDELVHEFDSYIDVSRRSAADLQRFNTHCGSAVDSVISINRWTSRYIDSLAPAGETSPPSPSDGGSSAFTRWTSWIFSPFMPPDRYVTERMILDKYIEHTAQVSERIASLILEAQAVLAQLTRAEDHLTLIHELASRDSAAVASRREEILWTLWTLVGGNTARLHNLSQQLTLLRRVDVQRADAVRRVSALVLELEAIQMGLEDLRDRVAAPELQDATGRPAIPLSVHIDTIDRGVERLEEARSRISAAENDRVKEALRRVGLKDEPLIEDR